MTLFIGRGVILEAESRTGAGTGAEAADDTGAGADTGTAIAFSIRLWTWEGSMTRWPSSGGGVGPMSLL